MIYKVLGLMSGSSLDGLDIAYCHLEESGGVWHYEIECAACIPFDAYWKDVLTRITEVDVPSYMKYHTAFGRWMGQQVNEFINQNNLHYKVHLIASHGHTAYHFPTEHTTVQLGCGAQLAASVGLPVVSELRAMDMAFDGQGAPIVPISEQLLFKDYTCFLNIGGISNLSIKKDDGNIIAFDVCPANRVLNALTEALNLPYDDKGNIAKSEQVNETLLQQLNALPYYKQASPKSLGNEFGLNTILPILQNSGLTTHVQIATYTQHIATQIIEALQKYDASGKLLVTGGGAFNDYLISLLHKAHGIDVIVPDEATVQYKESLAMALIGALRWREEESVLATVTGAKQNSIAGALWMVNN
jgi:anhydro-N-acetylmuramic acid kinase